ncbi:hypothetical protein VTN00DRAFT_1340 [Thermoascus crustaceus]|uniref:uncharacterized protein n=1 Tax=Thermoascus crustaceus TaxID=5088 RepID=UPI0037432310
MHFPSKISVALVASLAAVGEAVHPLHLHQARRYGNSTNVITSSILVIPTPLEKASESITTPPVALGTGLAGAVPVPEQDPKTEDLTLTYTLGAGTSTTVVTTTIHRTATQTHYVVETPEPEVNEKAVSEPEDESTTTLSSTSTTTKYITVYPVASGAANDESANGQPGNSQFGHSQGNGLDVCAQATVTVTEKEVVTVTAIPTPVNDPTNAIVDPPAVTTPEVNEEVPAFTTPSVVPTLPAVPTVVPPPFSNGTLPKLHKPSGFLTSKYPFPSGYARL